MGAIVLLVTFPIPQLQQDPLLVTHTKRRKLTSIMSPKSGKVMETGLKRDLRLSGSSTLPAYPGFMVMKNPQVGFTLIS